MEGLIKEIERKLRNKFPLVISFEGRSGVGKSTLTKQLAEAVGGVVVQTDDFYSGIGEHNDWKDKTTAEKYDLVIDWKRLRKEVIEPLLSGRKAAYHPFAFKRGYGLDEKVIEIKPAKVVILDGIYSSRPELLDLIDISVKVNAEDQGRRNRLLKREGEEFIKKWHSIWDEVEEYYFDNIRKEEDFDFVVYNE